MFWYLNKETNTAEIYSGVTALLRDQEIENTEYKSRLENCFSRKKLDKFEDETYRIEKRDLIRAKRKS